MRAGIVIAAVLALAVDGTAVAQGQGRDAIRIVRIDPAGPVVWGVETTFTIEVEARLASMDDGVAMVGFNTEAPLKFRMASAHLLAPGTQRLTFEVTVVPVNWGDRADFTVMVNMGPRALTVGHWRPTARDRFVIGVTPRTASVQPADGDAAAPA